MTTERGRRDRDMFARWEARYTETGSETAPLIPAATVVVLRDTDAGIETLMLRRNSKLEFVGGMWVFPGGRIDPDDHRDDDEDVVEAARRAAVREAAEEAGQELQTDGLAWFSHWTPPAITPKRFSTWFFAARSSGDAVNIDGGEIHDSGWMTPVDAMQRRNALEIELAPPTWVTLETLALYDDVDSALAALDAAEVTFFETRISRGAEGAVALWEGDAGYASGDADAPGRRHRLTMAETGYVYDRSGHD
ncbi:MAG: NUDIX hydrolase [Acidimicrobiales bacterium]